MYDEGTGNAAASTAEVRVAENQTTASPSANDEQAGSNLDKVREILFGAQARDYDKRLIRIEERIAKEAVDLRDEVRRRFDSLESFVKQELDSLGNRITGEHDQRSEALRVLSRELEETARSLDARISQLDTHVANGNRELREQILEQSKSMLEEISRKHGEAMTTLQRKSDELRSDKADRSALASLFTEMALRLNNEFKIPGADEIRNE
jgi:DNA anti-recombination protein RmuC